MSYHFVRNVSGGLYNLDYTTPHQPVVQFPIKRGSKQDGVMYNGLPYYVRTPPYHEFNLSLQGANDLDVTAFTTMFSSNAPITCNLVGGTHAGGWSQGEADYGLAAVLRGTFQAVPLGDLIVQSMNNPYDPILDEGVESRVWVVTANFGITV
jgi:hypothetical protein